MQSCINLSMQMMLQADQCKPQHIANILWAFGTLGYKPSQHLLDILSTQATAKLPGFNPQNLANLIWAFARSAFHTKHCLSTLLHVACDQVLLAWVTFLDLAKLHWTYAVLALIQNTA